MKLLSPYKLALLGLFSISSLSAQLDAGTERGGTELAGTERGGIEIPGTERGGTERGGVLSDEPTFQGDAPTNDPGVPLGGGIEPDTFHEECSHELDWDQSQGGTGGGGSQFLNMNLNYNDDGLGGAHQVTMNWTMDVTRSQNEGFDTGVFSFVLNNGSGVGLGTDPATNAMIVIDPNAGMSVYEYDVNPANDFGGVGQPGFSDPIFNTAQAVSNLGVELIYGDPVLNPLTGQWTQDISLSWDNTGIEDYFEGLGVDPGNVRPDEKIGLWGRNWGGIDVEYETDLDGGESIAVWDPAWPADSETRDTNGFMDFVGPTVKVVPEPTSGLMVLLGATMGLLRRRR